MRVLCLVCTIPLILADQATEETELPDAFALEQRALASRRALLRGEVEYRYVRLAKSGKTQKEIECRIIFDGERIRSDVIQPLVMRFPDGGVKNTKDLHKYVFREDAVLYHTDARTPSGDGTPAHRHAPDQPNARMFANYKTDPRVIGVVPMDPGHFHAATLESFLTRADRKNTTVVKETVEELETWRIEYDRGDGVHVIIWIAPTQDHSIVRASSESDYRGGALIDRIECENTKHGDGDAAVWFPQKVHYERTLDGERLFETLLEVKRAEFEQPIDETVFTLAGMDIPVGTALFESPPFPGPARMWDGSKLAPSRLRPAAPELGAEGPTSHRSSRLIALSIGLALLASVVLLVYWSRLRGKAGG